MSRIHERVVAERKHALFGKNYHGESICANYSPLSDLAKVKGDNFFSAEDMRLEIIAAEIQEDAACHEQRFLQLIRDKLAGTGPEWCQEFAPTPRDGHMAFGVLIQAQARALPKANVMIVSPTALTILQVASTFERADDDTSIVQMKPIGRLGDLQIIVDVYGHDSLPVLIGYIPDDPAERKASYAFRKLYLHEGFDEGWTQVRVNTDRLSFLI